MGNRRRTKPYFPRRNPSIVRVYQENQVINVVRSVPMNVDRVSEITLNVRGELEDVFDGTERVVALGSTFKDLKHVYES